MKITKTDLNSMRFAYSMLNEVATQTLSEQSRSKIELHAQRIRKLHNMLLLNVGQMNLPLSDLCQDGISDDSRMAQGIKALCPDIT